jgi:hypothetical protein
MLILALTFLVAQSITGWKEHNETLSDFHWPPETYSEYLVSGHFLQSTFENWESEFFQMALFVLLTKWLVQKGSSESNKPKDEQTLEEIKEEETKEQLRPNADSPWPVWKGGFALKVYKNSLTLTLFLLFIFSFMMHWLGSWWDYNEMQAMEGKQLMNFLPYLSTNRFWFESFQNWQSEFLSVFAIVFLSIFLRQEGSSQSKKVNDPHSKTGE